MSTYTYKPFDFSKDVLNRNDIVKMPLWTNNFTVVPSAPESILSEIYLNSEQTGSWESNYYINAYLQPESNTSQQDVLFSVAFGTYTAITSSYMPNDAFALAYPSYTIYRQLINSLEGGDSNYNFSLPQNNQEILMSTIHAISISRNLFNYDIDVNNFRLYLSGSGKYFSSGSYHTTTHSSMSISCHTSSIYKSYDSRLDKYLLLGSNSDTSSISVGWIYPKKGIIILKSDTIEENIGSSNIYNLSGSNQPYAITGSSAAKGIYDTNGTLISPLNFYPKSSIFNMMGWIQDGQTFQSYKNNIIESTYYFCKVDSNEFISSTNPTWGSGSSNSIRKDLAASGRPKTYITTIGLHDGTDIVAIAKLSRPIPNSDITSMGIQIRLEQ